MSSNPFRTAEKVGKVIGNVAAWALVLLSVGVLLAAVVAWGFQQGWGWWSLLSIPGIALGLVFLMALVGLGYWMSDSIKIRWRSAKYRWDERKPYGCWERIVNYPSERAVSTFAIGRVMRQQMNWWKARMFKIGRVAIIVAVTERGKRQEES